MRFHWLHRANSPNINSVNQAKASTVIVFFSGWGFDDSVVRHLRTDDMTDVLFVYDYRSLAEPLPDLSHYQQRILIAWSFGVSAYCAWRQQQASLGKTTPSLTQRVAINGSKQAVDRQYGIAEVVMQKTIDTLSQESFQHFAARCYNLKPAENSQHYCIDVVAAKAELIAVQQRQYHPSDETWQKIWISRQDKIFSYRNLSRAWADWPQQITVIDAPHVPFAHWQTWHELLE